MTFIRDLAAHGPRDVKRVTPDAHSGPVAAIGSTVPGASWRRCRTRHTEKQMSTRPWSSWPWITTTLHSVYNQPGTPVNAQLDRYAGRDRQTLRVGIGWEPAIEPSLRASLL